VHEVQERDETGGRDAPRDHGIAPPAADRGQDQEPGGAGEQQAHPDGVGHEERAVRVEEAAGRVRGRARGQEVRRLEKHDRQVLRDVAGILDRPLADVPEFRVGVHLLAIEVLVGGVEDLPRGGVRVPDEHEDRDRRAERDRPDAAPRRPAPDEDEV
jgi:hypothetical protein